MHFSAYFIRNKLLWKRLTDGAEIVVAGSHLAALIDTTTGRILEHGSSRTVKQIRDMTLRSNPGIKPDRLIIVDREISRISRQACNAITRAIAGGQCQDLQKVLDHVDYQLAA